MVEYDPFGPDVMTDPLPIYRELRAHYRAYPLPQYDAFALPRFSDVWEMSRDRTHFSIVEGPVSHRERLLVHNDGPPDRTPPAPIPSFSMLDPPRHTSLRGAIAPAFTPGAVRRGEDAMRAQARALLDALVPRGRFDVVRDLAAPVATVATCAQMGLPELEAARVTELVNTSARRDGVNPGIGPEGQQAMLELGALIAEVLHEQLAQGAPTPVVAALHALEVDGRRLTEIEITTQLITMVIGGVESLPKVIGGGVRSLAAHPDQRAALAGDLARVPAAFEEILRLHLPLQVGTRTLLEDAEIAGTRMRAGQRVMLLYVSANRDDDEFPEADRFDIDRAMDRHLGFGHGVHFCIGAHSARLEAIVILQELLARVPEYEVDEAGVERLPSEFQIGDTAVPIEFPHVTTDDPRAVRIEGWMGPWPDDDPDANFKRDVALYAHADPLSTLRNLSDAIDVPLGALCHYVLAKWATAGSGGLLELGPTMTRRLAAVCDEADAADTIEARLAAYAQLRDMIGWLRYPLDHPEVYE